MGERQRSALMLMLGCWDAGMLEWCGWVPLGRILWTWEWVCWYVAGVAVSQTKQDWNWNQRVCWLLLLANNIIWTGMKNKRAARYVIFS